MNGKGSKQRPLEVRYEEFATNWDRIFVQKNKEEKDTKQVEEKISLKNKLPSKN